MSFLPSLPPLLGSSALLCLLLPLPAPACFPPAYLLRLAAGARRKFQREERERVGAQQKLRAKLMKIKTENASALKLQSVFRGHLGRLAARKWAIKKAEIDAQRNLEYAAAAAVQRTFRGFLGRLEAEDKRIEMAEFIGQMRAREAQEEEEEYWRTHTLARWKRRVKNFVIYLKRL